MRQLTTAVAVAAGLLAVSCGGSNHSGPSSSSTTTATTASSKPPLAQAALANLLAAPADVDIALGLPGTKTDKTLDALNQTKPQAISPRDTNSLTNACMPWTLP